MSLEQYDDDVKRKHLTSGGATGGKSIHESAATQLLYTKIPKEKLDEKGAPLKDENGEPIFALVDEVSARTELPSPANTTVLHQYGRYLQKAFGRPNMMNDIEMTYEIKMISKNRKGRGEYTMVATASAINSNNTSSDDILKKVQES